MCDKNIVTYKTSSGVFFQNNSGEVYLRNVNTRNEYLYNEIVFDILTVLQEKMSFADLIDKLLEIYEIDDPNKFRNEIDECLKMLVKEGNVDSFIPEVSSRTANGGNVDKSIFLHIRDSKNAEHKIWSSTLELTYRCSERCRHCYLDNPDEKKPQDELSFVDYVKVIDELAALGCMNVQVTGGEPTLHPDFIEICSYIVKKRMLVDIYTNALNISDALFEQICDLKINSISFSLYGGTPEFHDYITQVPGSFYKTLFNILKFKAAGLDIFVKNCLFKNQYSEYKKLQELSRRLRFRLITSTFLASTHTKDDRVHMQETEEEYRQFLKDEYSQLRMDDSKPHRDLNSFVCTAGRSSLNICPNGDVKPCGNVDLVLGNVKKDNLSDIWHNSEKLKDFYKIKYVDLDPACKDCCYSDFCSICLGDAYDSKTGKISKCSYTCSHAKIRYEEFLLREK